MDEKKEKTPSEVFGEIYDSWRERMLNGVTDVKHRGQLLNLHFQFLNDLNELAPLFNVKAQEVEEDEVYTEEFTGFDRK